MPRNPPAPRRKGPSSNGAIYDLMKATGVLSTPAQPFNLADRKSIDSSSVASGTPYRNTYRSSSDTLSSISETLAETPVDGKTKPGDSSAAIAPPDSSSSLASSITGMATASSSTDSVATLIPRPKFITMMTIADLIQSFQCCYDSKSAHVLVIVLREDTKGIQHQYLLVQVRVPRNTENTLWIRLERNADEYQPKGMVSSRSSSFQPDDRAMLAQSDSDLTKSCPSVVKGQIRFKGPELVSLFTLQALLASFISEAKIYIAATENCWFFCSVILSALSHKYPNEVTGHLGNWRIASAFAQKRIHTLFTKILNDHIHLHTKEEQYAQNPNPMPPKPDHNDSDGSTISSSSTNPISFYARNQLFFNFSNFSPHSIGWNKQWYPTAEHLFHAFKFVGQDGLPEYFATFSNDPGDVSLEVKRLERHILPQTTEEQIKKMETVLCLKFTQHEELLKELLSTGSNDLVYNSPEDDLWGTGPRGAGRNELGKALMRLRSKYSD